VIFAIAIAIWLGVALILCFVLLPYLSAKQIVPKYKIEDWGIVFSMWPISFPALIILYTVILILGGTAFIIMESSKHIFSRMEKKFQGHVKEDPK
jgi:hypothetical protein